MVLPNRKPAAKNGGAGGKLCLDLVVAQAVSVVEDSNIFKHSPLNLTISRCKTTMCSPTLVNFTAILLAVG